LCNCCVFELELRGDEEFGVKSLPAGCITTPGVRYLIYALKYVVFSITVYEDILFCGKYL